MGADVRRIKSIDKLLGEHSDQNYALRKTLGPGNLIALGVAATISFGVYILPGIAAANYGGSLVVLSLALDGVLSLLFALCYAEIASTIPIAGSAYTYTYATLGEVFAWTTGWLLILEYATVAALVARGCQAYLTSLLSDFSINIAPASSPRLLQAIPSILIILMLTMLLYRGVRESASANSIIVLVNMLALLWFVSRGTRYLLGSEQLPKMANMPLRDAWHTFGIAGLLGGAAILILAFAGIDAVATASEEARRPQRDIAVGMLGTTLIAGTLTAAVIIVLLRIVPSSEMNIADPLALAMHRVSGKGTSSIFVEFGALMALISSLLVLLLGLSRILYSMAEDRLLPPAFSKLHHRYKTPSLTTVSAGLATMVITLAVPVRELAELASAALLPAMATISVTVVVLRYRRPDLRRAFRVPLFPLVPIVSALGSVTLLLSLPYLSIIRLAIWMALGLILYFAYGYRHSRIAASDSGRALIESR